MHVDRASEISIIFSPTKTLALISDSLLEVTCAHMYIAPSSIVLQGQRYTSKLSHQKWITFEYTRYEQELIHSRYEAGIENTTLPPWKTHT